MVNDENGDALPPGWIITTLGEIAHLIGGGTPSRAIPEYFTGEIIWLTPTEVPKNMIAVISESREKITEEALMNSSARIVPSGSVLMTSRASIGYVAIAGVDLTTNQGFATFIPENGVLNSYLAYWLWSQADHFKSIATGTTFKEISKAVLRNESFPFPPLAEQQRIVEAIEAQFTRLDAGVAALKRLRASLRRYKAAILKAAAEGRLVEQDPDDEPASELLQRILKERRAKWEAEQRAKGKDPRKLKYEEPAAPNTADLPDLPEGWVWATVEQLLSKGMINGRSVQSFDEGFPVLRLTALKNGGIDFNEFKLGKWGEEDISTYLVRQGDFLVARGNGSLKLVGRGGLVHIEPAPIAFPDTMIRLRFYEDGINSNYVSLIWNSPFLREQVEKTAHTTAGIYKINQQHIAAYIIPLPPTDEQNSIVMVGEQILSFVNELEHLLKINIQRAERLRQSILREAFAGRLVPQDPDDEPASALLEKIHASRQLKKRTSKP